MIRDLIKIYSIIIMLDAILSFFPEMNKYSWRKYLKKWSDFTCEPVRKRLPPGLPFDFSSMVVIFSLYFFTKIFSYLW